jgi:hypothetical protein
VEKCAPFNARELRPASVELGPASPTSDDGDPILSPASACSCQ